MNRFLKSLILMMLVINWNSGHLWAFQEEVDWIWHDRKPTARKGPECMKFIVKAYPIRILRGKVSGRTCLKNSIMAYRKGDHEGAFGWILAGQCHDRLARETLVKNAPKVMEYVLERYRDKVSSRSFPLPTPSIKPSF